MLREGNGTEPTKFHEGLPWPNRTDRSGWRGLIIWDPVGKKQRLEIKCRHVVPAPSSQVVLGLPALFYPSAKWMDHSKRLLKLSPLTLASEKFSTWEILRLICNIMWAKDLESISLRSTPCLCINGWWMPPWLEIHLSSPWPERPKFLRATSQMACVIFSMEGLFPFNSGGESQRERGCGDCNSPKHFIISACVITSLIPF